MTQAYMYTCLVCSMNTLACLVWHAVYVWEFSFDPQKKKPTDCILSSIYIFIVVFEQNVCVALFRIGMDAAASQMRLNIQRNFIGISSSLQTSHLLIKDFLIRRPTKLMCLRAFFPLKKKQKIISNVKCFDDSYASTHGTWHHPWAYAWSN